MRFDDTVAEIEGAAVHDMRPDEGLRECRSEGLVKDRQHSDDRLHDHLHTSRFILSADALAYRLSEDDLTPVNADSIVTPLSLHSARMRSMCS